VSRFLSRLAKFVLEHSQVGVVFLLGSVLVIWGAFVWTSHPRASTILVSIGASLVAAAVVTFLSPLNQEVYQRFLGLGIKNIYPSRDDFPARDWVRWLRRAKHHCTLLGVAHQGWRRDPEFFDALADRLQHEVQVKIFFLDPTSVLSEIREQEEKRQTRQETRTSIKQLWEFRQQLPHEAQNRLTLYVYNSTPSSGTTWIDESMLIAHYLAGFENLTSPALLVKPVEGEESMSDLYSIYAQNVRNVEKKESTHKIDEANIGQYTEIAQEGADAQL